MIKRLISKLKNRPVPGIDWHYSRYCQKCRNYEDHATKGGVNGTQHCYTCGHVSTPPRHSDGRTVFGTPVLEYCIASSKAHWQNYPIIPYNWHELNEDERWNILRNRSK